MLPHFYIGRNNKKGDTMSLQQALGMDNIGLGHVGTPIAVVASAATIAVTSKFTRITGNTTIDTITAINYIGGPICLFNTDAAVGTLSTAGNVAVGVTLTRYKLFFLIYDTATTKWYPSNVS